MTFAPVVAIAELWDGDMTARTVNDCNVLLVRLDGVVHAYENRCAHLGVALSKGRLDGPVLTCSRQPPLAVWTSAAAAASIPRPLASGDLQ